MANNDEVHRRNPYRSELWCEPVPGRELRDWSERERDICVSLAKAIWVDRHFDPYPYFWHGRGDVGSAERAVLDAVQRGFEWLPHYMAW